jgi:hypothetical protein
MSLNQSMVEEEFRRVHNRHQRVLGELNLDVEEMLMPSMPSNQQPENNIAFIPTTPMLDPSDTMDFLGNGEVNDGLNGAGNRSSNNNYCLNMDLDSGFSGSNSSYIGSLRYKKTTEAALMNNNSCTITNYTAPTLHQIQQPINHHHHQYTDSGSSSIYCGSSGSTVEVTDEIGMLSLHRSSSSLHESGKKMNYNHSQKIVNQGAKQAVKCDKVSVWKTKSQGWIKKLPGFSSTTNINKTFNGK